MEGEQAVATLAAAMRDDWNRRIAHDYRFWMSDGHRDDAAMWESGARDLAIVLDGVTSEGTFLELGCGVGRLLRSAAARFAKVIGVDVSDAAINRARELLVDCENVSPILGNGTDLAAVPTSSVDVAISFAALTSIPTPIIAQYLTELHRVVVPSGTVRLQVYLGSPIYPGVRDTLHLRCFAREDFSRAIAAAGFDLEWIRELQLPFAVSAPELGIEAVIVSLRRSDRRPAAPGEISRMLAPQGEPEPEQNGSALEVWMALNFAKELIERGDLVKGEEALRYARSLDISPVAATVALSEELEKTLASAKGRSVAHSRTPSQIVQRFPSLWRAIEGSEGSDAPVTVSMTTDGPVIGFDGQALDHPTKPVAAGERWAKQVIEDARAKKSERIVVIGFGAGYHIEALVRLSTLPVVVIEPSPAVMKVAVQSRDLSLVLDRCADVLVGEELGQIFRSTDELVIRPQTQAVAPAFIHRARTAHFGLRGKTLLHPRIAVLGPFSGGTLPITTYVSRALALQGQKVRHWDVSGFANGVSEVEKFVKEKGRRELLWATYSETVSQVILTAAQEKPVDILICMAQAPITPRVLTELRKQGVITVLWFMEDYLRFHYWRQYAPYYDFIFTIQQGECLAAMKAAGAAEAHYLPMAADPGIHAPVQLSPDERARWGSEISFLGAGYHNRQQMFASLADLPFKIWGTEWPGCRPFDKLVQEGGRRLAPEEYVKIFGATDINLNLHSSSERDGVDPTGDFVNPRTFELGAAGAFQLTDDRQLLPALYRCGEELITFSSLPDLRDKIAFYRAHPEERRRVAELTRARTLREHTYQHRLDEMLRVIYAARFEQLKAREERSPWTKMRERAAIDPELKARCDAAFERGEEPILDGLVADIVAGKGKLSETEKKLLFLFHVRKQIVRMRAQENGEVK